MPVYFIQVAGNGPIKIGYAANVRSRLASLQTASFLDLKVIGQIEGDCRLERALHQRLAPWHIVREWFRAEPPVFAALRDPPSIIASPGADYWPIIKEIGTAQGVSSDALKQWKRRGVPGKFRLPIVRLAAERGIAIPDAALDSPAEPVAATEAV